MTPQQMARADEERESAAASSAARAAEEHEQRLARLAGAGQARAAKPVPLAKADLVSSLDGQLDWTRAAMAKLEAFLQRGEAIEGDLAKARQAETEALIGKAFSVDERAKRMKEWRDRQSVLQYDLAEHDKDKEAVVVELRNAATHPKSVTMDSQNYVAILSLFLV